MLSVSLAITMWLPWGLVQYYYFIRLLGRPASDVSLECTLHSHPNMVTRLHLQDACWNGLREMLVLQIYILLTIIFGTGHKASLGCYSSPRKARYKCNCMLLLHIRNDMACHQPRAEPRDFGCRDFDLNDYNITTVLELWLKAILKNPLKWGLQ